ncbi:class I SAM-dependent methyltransferase [Actinoplanes sp. LDG1-06]|uniref:Class I SAM-dependent methyltransferase n=1 Tax=Paractinoplanes ovalisporus TaxID=2810368 RepID=A0ABS2AM68_9ACTN|nr:methyltransferase domain-containing protein [Actinoplanes ovalisporus]MBM2620905.1 class I SAM-dependent methyltransferase [Actinoplanes ovalisporus]
MTDTFTEQLLTDFAGTGTTALTVLGDRLGLYRALTGAGPTTAAKLAATTGLNPRLVTEWLTAQAVSGQLVSDGETFELPAEHAAGLSLVGGAEIVAGYFLTLDKLERAFRGDGGLPYADMPACVHHGIERFFRTAYEGFLVQAWFPAVPGLVARLESGARVADVGCGHGFATTLIGQTWPATTVTGFDNHEPSIAIARAGALEAGVDNVEFRRADASAVTGPFDVVFFFDSLHDLGDPPAALLAAYHALTEGGLLVAVEPWSADDFTTVIGNPVARANYNASTALCTPGSLSQPGAYGLGTQGGPAKRLQLLADAGFADPVVAADTGLNLVLAARK